MILLTPEYFAYRDYEAKQKIEQLRCEGFFKRADIKYLKIHGRFDENMKFTGTVEEDDGPE